MCTFCILVKYHFEAASLNDSIALLRLVLKCELVTRGQQRHIAFYACVSHASPRSLDHPCVHILWLPTSLLLKGQKPCAQLLQQFCHQTSTRFVWHGLTKKPKMFQVLIYMHGLTPQSRLLLSTFWALACCPQNRHHILHWSILLLHACQGCIRTH